MVNIESRLFAIAVDELAGVGDAALGEWREASQTFAHLRRRLTFNEMRIGGIDQVCDVRGTPEFTARIDRVRPYLPAPLRNLPMAAYH